MRPPTFLEFCDELGVVLEPGQRVVCLVAFDGVQPRDLRGGERELARAIFGDLEVVPPDTLGTFAAVCGLRSGKSYVFGALRLLHLALSADVSRLAPGEDGVCPIVAPTLKAARDTLRFAQGAAANHTGLAAQCSKLDAADELVVHRGKRRVVLRVGAANAGGLSGRGRSIVGAYLEEAAFFRDRDFKVNDAAIYAAIAPRVVLGGQLVIASTPWARSGLLYKLYRDNYGKPTTCLVAHAPTAVIRSDPHILAQVARERERDPENAAREADAAWLDAGSTQFFDEATLEAALDAELVLGAPPRPLDEVTAGADFGFARNSSTLAIAHRAGRTYRLAELLEDKPEPGKPLKPSAVCARFAGVLGQHVRELRRDGVVMADGHYRESVAEHLSAFGISLRDAPAGAAGKAEAYVRTRTLMREGRLRIPPLPRLLAQLRAIVGRPLSGGGLAISSPTGGDGAHGDLVSALVLVAWQAYGASTAPAPRVETEGERAVREENERVEAMMQNREQSQRRSRKMFG